MSNEKIILHGMTSPNVIKVIIMLEECGLPYELRHIAVFKHEQFLPEFLQLNPFGKVPVLEDSQLGRPLAESGAILLWLAEREGKFLPAQQPERAEVMQWLMIQMANFGPMLGQLNHYCSVLESGTVPYAEARYREIARRLFRTLDDHLVGRDWIAGSRYSIADMAMKPWCEYLERLGFDPVAHPALVSWRQRVGERPAVMRAQSRATAEFAEKLMAARNSATPADLDRFFNRTDSAPEVLYSILRQRQN